MRPLAVLVYRGGNLAAAVANGGAVSHFHLDHLGSTRMITNASKGIVERSEYYPFGEESSVSGAETKKYTGHERDYNAASGSHVKTDSANPMVSGAPAINTDLRIVATSTGEFAVGGTIDGFPAASLTVTNEQGRTFTVFNFDPNSVGNGPTALFPWLGDQWINEACSDDGCAK
jgi:hypothetical protein